MTFFEPSSFGRTILSLTCGGSRLDRGTPTRTAGFCRWRRFSTGWIGSRPRQPADQRYESAYLFGAICPARGVGAALAMPFADTHAMQAHLDEIAKTVAKGAHAVLLLDCARRHTTAKLVVPR